MKIINDGLPDALYNAIVNDSYSKGDADISVTELISPPQQRALKRKYADKIVENASDRVWSLLGQVMHGILERAKTEGIVEQRLSLQVNGWKVSGGMDIFYAKDGLLKDYKLTTVYKVIDFKTQALKPTAPEEWVQQLNIYAEMLRQSGETVNGLSVIAIFRDWSSGELKRAQLSGSYYPEKQTMEIALPLIPSDEVRAYILERVKLHQANGEVKDDNYTECTPPERWAKEDSFAIIKDGAKKAHRVVATREAAQIMLDNLGGKGYNIVHREGESIRCTRYCIVKNECKQYKKMQESKKTNE